MSLLASLLWAWVALHVFSAIISAFLYARQRQPEYAAFAGVAVALGLYCAASASFTAAPTQALAARARDVQTLAGALGFAAYVLFGWVLLGRPRAVLVRAVLVASAIISTLALTGVFLDPARPMRWASQLPWAYPYRDVAPTPALLALSVVALLFGVGVLMQLGPLARRRAEARLLWIAIALTVGGWIHDVVLRVARVQGLYLTEHLSSLGGLVVSYLLLDRFVQTANALTQRTLELRHRYDELQHVQGELVQKEQLAAVGELSAVIAHEVRNPLAVLKNAVAGLRREKLGDEDRATLLQVLDEESDRLNRLVRDLLTYARPVEPQWSTIDLGELVRGALGVARKDPVVSMTNVDVEIEVDGVEGTIEGDKDLLQRVFANIVANAMQAMPEGGVLTVRGEPVEIEGGPGIAVRFMDTGEGMDTLVRARARDPFFTTKSSGTGLGLAIVERIVKAHGGTVMLQSSGQEGSTVSITLPRQRSPKD